MKRLPAGLAVVWMILVAAASGAAAADHVPAQTPRDYPSGEAFPAQKIVHAGRLDVDVWINKDEGGVYRPGESMLVYFRSSADSYMLVFNVDTDGYIHLVYPYGPEDPPYVDGGRTYQIPARSDPYDLVADGPPGIEYVVAVASPVPFRDLPWYLTADRADGDRPDLGNDDDTDSGQITGDPYVGIDRIIQRIAPPGREDRIATNETYFYIGRRVEYPRYVCADCHTHPFYFDPYVNACSVFEIRVDATWAHYAPIRFGTVRPRFLYRVRPQAPTRYRQWKSQWSSLDGRTLLRSHFLPERDLRNRRERAPLTRSARPEFRDLRRYREGRIWRGRDEILRLRENRDRVGPNQDQGNGGRGRPNRGDGPPPSENRGWWHRGERKAPDNGGAREQPAPQREDRGNRDNRDRGDNRDKGNKDQGGNRDQGNKDQGGNRDQGNKDQGGNRDQGNKDQGGSRDRGDSGDKGDRGDHSDKGDRGGDRQRSR